VANATALDAMAQVQTYIPSERARFVLELKEFVSFPSISAQLKHAEDLKRCADWLATHLRRISLAQVTIIPTRSHPIVYAEWCHAPGQPTVLIYGHYDVQPAGYTLYEKTTIRPALTISGIQGGYQGAGPKAVIPERAIAKLDFRLVPDQRPEEIEGLFRHYVERVTPTTVRSFVRKQSSAKPAMIDRHHPAIRAACSAYRRGFGATLVFLRSGGTIPVIRLLRDILGMQTVLMGFALPDDRVHAPNEKFHLPNFFNGIATSIYFLEELVNWSIAPDRRLVTTEFQNGGAS
jgi:acetylornithine deacetylase/succinyl-diaminopimelate desuccinylase-like protein